jgi:dimethylhistidine N-methyltransferase
MQKIKSQFEKDIIKGLTDYPKHLPSKYIYDERGDKLFQEIMAMPEYYLTNCEFEILSLQKSNICDAFFHENGFDLIELGAGDGKKTKILLKELVKKNFDFKYLPVDISKSVLDELQATLKNEMPEVKIEPQQGTYFDILSDLDKYRNRKKVILFLGSNIGNLLHENAIAFLKQIQENMHEDDILFMGFDQKKNPQTILEAYNDETKITESFNKNLLKRINHEFDANFSLEDFLHWETYNPETGTALSFLVSKKAQNVRIEQLDLDVNFKAWESLHIEISQKYDEEVIEWIADKADLDILDFFSDDRDFYRNYVFRSK